MVSRFIIHMLPLRSLETLVHNCGTYRHLVHTLLHQMKRHINCNVCMHTYILVYVSFNTFSKNGNYTLKRGHWYLCVICVLDNLPNAATLRDIVMLLCMPQTISLHVGKVCFINTIKHSDHKECFIYRLLVTNHLFYFHRERFWSQDKYILHSFIMSPYFSISLY